MSISATNKTTRPFLKTAMVSLAVSILCLLINLVYALFGHGVRSVSMTWMFLYPLVGGTFLFLLLHWVHPRVYPRRYRLFYNAHFAGIAALTLGSFFQGILEIAGASSALLPLFYYIGLGLLCAGLVILVFSIRIQPSRSARQKT